MVSHIVSMQINLPFRNEVIMSSNFFLVFIYDDLAIP